MSRATNRDVQVGLVVVVGLAALIGLVALTNGGTGVLSKRRTIDVVFRDGQGIRVGSPVRVAGLDSGRVEALDLVEMDGALRALVRIAIPADLAAKLRQDVRITIQDSLTGQNCVNVVSSGRSEVALVPGQVVQGVETTFFDPILEQVGLGPVERSHLSHTIEEIRDTVDAVGPRCRQILAALQETSAGLSETAGTIRPTIETAAAHFEALARQLDAAAPRIQVTLSAVETTLGAVRGIVTDNREDVRASIANVRGLSGNLNETLLVERPKVDALLEGLKGTRARADQVLYKGDILTTQAAEILARNRANLERTFANVRGTTDYAEQLVQKLYGNPFYLSPFYKPTPEDKRAEVAFDNAHAMLKGVKELTDTVKTLEALQARQLSEAQRQEVAQLYQSAKILRDYLDQQSRRLATELQSRARR